MVDKSVLENILTNLEEYLGDLEEIKSEKKLEDYQKDKISRRYTAFAQIIEEKYLDQDIFAIGQIK